MNNSVFECNSPDGNSFVSTVSCRFNQSFNSSYFPDFRIFTRLLPKDFSYWSCYLFTTAAGGTCMDVIDGYACVCPSHYIGSRCETPRDSRCGLTAAANPCLNGGTCVDLRSVAVDDFRCRCPPGFSGRLCELNTVDGCSSGRPACANGATCYDLVGGDFLCSCPTGYTGRRCDESVGACVSHPCRYGVTCIDMIDGTFICICPGKGDRAVMGHHGSDNQIACDWRPIANVTHVGAVVGGRVSGRGSGSSASAVVVVDASSMTAAQLVVVVVLGGGIPVVVLTVTLIALLIIRRRGSVTVPTPEAVTNNRSLGHHHHLQQQRQQECGRVAYGGGNCDVDSSAMLRVSVEKLAAARCVKITNEDRQRETTGKNGNCVQFVASTDDELSPWKQQQQQQQYRHKNEMKTDPGDENKQMDQAKLLIGTSRLSMYPSPLPPPLPSPATR